MKLDKKRIIISLLVLVMLIFSSKIFWTSISLYNKVIPEDYKINAINFNTLSIRGEVNKLDYLLSRDEYRLIDHQYISTNGRSSTNRFSELEGDVLYDRYMSVENKSNIKFDYLIKLSLSQWLSGNVNRTFEIIDSINLTDLKQSEKDEYNLLYAGYHLASGDLEKTISILDDIDSEKYSLTVSVLRQYINILNEQNNEIKIHLGVGNDHISKMYLNLSKYIVDVNNADYHVDASLKDVQGRVYLDKKALSNAVIYSSGNSGSSYHNYMGSTNHGITDGQGKYTLENTSIEDNFTIGIPWQLIHNKQVNLNKNIDENTVDFKISDGAKFNSVKIDNNIIYYDIFDGDNDPNRSYHIQITAKDKKYDIFAYSTHYHRIPGDELVGQVEINLLDTRSNYSFNPDHTNVESLCEPLYLSGDYEFSLVISDDENIFNASNSIDLKTTVYYNGKDEVNSGDIYFSKGDYEKAIEYYKNNPDKHNLTMLKLIYNEGYIKEDEQLKGQDKEQFVKYSEEYMALYGENSGRLTDLASSRLLDLDEKLEIYNRIEVLFKDSIETNVIYRNINLRRIGYNKIYQGSFKDGLKDIKKYSRENDYLEFEILNNTLSEFKEKIDTKNYLKFYEKINNGNYKEALVELDSIPSELSVFYKILVLRNLDYNRELFKSLNIEEFDDYYMYEDELLNSMENEYLLEYLSY